MITRLWCAGILCPYPHLKRIHSTCLYCRWRRSYLGKWTLPPYWIDYTFPWKIEKHAVYAILKDGSHRLVAYRDKWHTLKIDPRGHFTMLRCMAIIVLDKLMKRFRRSEKPLMEFCEFLANFPIW